MMTTRKIAPRTASLSATILPALSLALCAACEDPAQSTADLVPQADPVLHMPATPDGRTLAELGFDTAALSDAGTPVYLAGRATGAPVRDAVAARRLLREDLGRALRLAPGSDFRLINEVAPAWAELSGRRFFRLRQEHGGVPVLGAELVVQADANGTVESVLGQSQPDLPALPAATLAADVAVRRALSTLAPAGAAQIHAYLGAHVVMTAAGAALAHGALVEYTGAAGRAIERLYVSATDGAVLARHPRVYRALDRDIYDLKMTCLKDGTELPGTSLVKEGGTTADTSGNNAYTKIGTTYWYYKHYFGRDSYDGAGATLKASVHGTFDTGAGSCTAANAAWIPDVYQQMVYGDGDIIQIKNTTLALDVTAHELTHAVTNLTSDLVYENESGALNEALSDILGEGAEAWAASGGSSAGNPMAITATANTWKVGEEVAGLLLFSIGALRLMNDPTKDGYSKDYYPERITGTMDSGGVHGNSGIANLGFHLLSQGGKHPRSKTAITVSGIGIEKALRIFFLSNTSLFTSTTDFKAARYATAQAARTLYGRCSAEWSSVHQSWDAVGVLGAWSLCQRPPVGF